MKFDGGLPGLVHIQKAIEHGHRNLVDFPINSMVIVHSFL